MMQRKQLQDSPRFPRKETLTVPIAATSNRELECRKFLNRLNSRTHLAGGIAFTLAPSIRLVSASSRGVIAPLTERGTMSSTRFVTEEIMLRGEIKGECSRAALRVCEANDKDV